MSGFSPYLDSQLDGIIWQLHLRAFNTSDYNKLAFLVEVVFCTGLDTGEYEEEATDEGLSSQTVR